MRPLRPVVVPLNMKTHFYILLLLIATICSCITDDHVVKDVVNPVLIMEVIEIPSTGTVTRINGEAKIKKNGINEYVPVVIDSSVNENDIVWLKKDTVIRIGFKDGSYVSNDPQSNDVFITFSLLKNQ